MAGLKFLLGMIPKTAKVEKAQENLQKDYTKFREIEASEELKRFYELEKEVNSPEYEARKKEILTKKFKDTREFEKEKEFKNLEKSKAVKNYFKVKDSKALEDYNLFLTSDTLKQLKELSSYVKSDAIAKAKAEMSPKQYKRSPEAAKEKEYVKTLKSKIVKRNKKYEKSTKYKEYLRTQDSAELKKYKELKEYVNTSKFLEFKEYMNLSGKEKYKLSEECKLATEFEHLKASQNITWYLKTKDNYPFAELEKWNLVFEDHFSSKTPDSSKWMYRYLNGHKMLDKPYVLADDKHAFTDGKNTSVIANHLTIVTRKENARCMTWDTLHGFLENEFEYTSDLVSTGENFTVNGGKIEAKVKIGKSSVTQAFSLMADRMAPHIDIFRYENKKLFAGNFWQEGKEINKSLEKTGGSLFTRDFFIYSLEWTDQKLTWRINDVVFKESSPGIPNEDLHLVFNASLKKGSKLSGLPSKMEIDWVKVFNKTQSKED